jgi:DNA-binding MarR family transcriptional regulator
LIFTALSRFTDLTPSTFEVLLYFLYQLGITIGILLGTIRKLKPPKLDLK